MEDLVIVDELAGFPGGPFSEAVVRAAGESIRNDCGWHVAPSVTETLTLDAAGGELLVLPSLWLTSVTEVRDMTGDTPRVLAGWRFSRAGMISRSAGWPVGFGAVEVDIVHGHSTCPSELLPVAADRTRRRAMQESLGSRSVSYSSDGDEPLSSAIFRYKLPSRP